MRLCSLFIVLLVGASLSLGLGLALPPSVHPEPPPAPPPRRPTTTTTTTPRPIGPVHTLILTRHGDSLWNGKYPGCREKFTGWTDVDLSPIGEREAMRTGELLASSTRGVVRIDALFTSALTRARMTAHHCWWAYHDRAIAPRPRRGNENVATMEEDGGAPERYVMDPRLNERHYGALQGLVKSDAAAGRHGHSAEDVRRWRRSWTAVPPPLDDDDPRRVEELRRYGNCRVDVPRSESLAMVAENRIRPFLEERLNPVLDDAVENDGSTGGEGATALVVAHANSIRALLGVLCDVERDSLGLAKLESMKIPTASPLVVRYRRTSEDGRYLPVDDGGAAAVANASGAATRNGGLPVYPLSSLRSTKCRNAAEDRRSGSRGAPLRSVG